MTSSARPSLTHSFSKTRTVRTPFKFLALVGLVTGSAAAFQLVGKYTSPVAAFTPSTDSAPSGIVLPATPDSATSTATLPTVLTTGSATNTEATSNQITVVASPTRLGEDRTLLLQPGESRQVSLTVRNTSDQTIDVMTSAIDFTVGEDGSTPIPLVTKDGVSNRWSLASWITVVPGYQTLAPSEVGELNALIEVPEDALPGGHYAMIVHQPMVEGTAGQNPAPGTQNSQTAVSPKVGTLVYVIVDGPINEAAFVRDLTFPKFTEFGPVPFSLMVDNQSDIHITPTISVDIYNLFGLKVETIVLEPKNVFPLLSREFEGQWDRIWGIGWYRAQVTMSYGDSGQIAIDSTSFWLLPITLLAGLGTAIIGLVAIIIAVRRHLIHRKNQDQRKIAELEQKLKEMANPEAPDERL